MRFPGRRLGARRGKPSSHRHSMTQPAAHAGSPAVPCAQYLSCADEAILTTRPPPMYCTSWNFALNSAKIVWTIW